LVVRGSQGSGGSGWLRGGEVVGLLVGARGCGQSAIRNSKKKHKSDIKMREIHSKHKEMVLKMGSFQSQYCAEKSPYTNGA